MELEVTYLLPLLTKELLFLVALSYCGSSRQKSRRDAEYQHETTVGHVRRSPRVEAVNPLVYLFLEHVLVILRRLK